MERFITQIYPVATSLLIGFFNGKKIIITDANNNLDFSDDAIFGYDTATSTNNFDGDSLSLVPSVQVSYEFVNNNSIESKKAFVKIKPCDFAYSSDINGDYFYAVIFEHKSADFMFNTVSYKLLVSHALNSVEGEFNKPAVRMQLKGLEYEGKLWLEKKVLFKISGNKFMIDSCSANGEKLYLKSYGRDETLIGWQVGDVLPDFLVKKIDYLQPNRKKYTIIDFWGSWCLPCLKSMPKLKNVYGKYKNTTTDLISVAYEQNINGVQKAKKMIQENQMEWHQLFETPMDRDITTAMNVVNFPTVLVIDKNNVIIVREIGEGNIESIEKVLKN